MNKQSIIGLVLIFAIFVGYMFWVTPSKAEREKQMAEYQRKLDSIAQVEAQEQAMADSLRAQQEALKAAQEAGPDIHVFEGRVCSGDQFISTKEQKDEIISNFGGLCCEMEGAAIAQTCYLNDVPFVIIRAISDKPSETEFVDYKVFEPKAAKLCAEIVEYMITSA